MKVHHLVIIIAVSLVFFGFFHFLSSRGKTASHPLGRFVPDAEHIATLAASNSNKKVCRRLEGIYTCSGNCGFHVEQVHCDFLPMNKILRWERADFYCAAPPDGCPSFIVFKKDEIPMNPSSYVPPVQIPGSLLSNYTLDGRVSVSYQYSNARSLSSPTTTATSNYIEWSTARFEETAKKLPINAAPPLLTLQLAFERYPIKNLHVAVLAPLQRPTDPFLESMCLLSGARQITTLTSPQYSIISHHPLVSSLSFKDYYSKIRSDTPVVEQFDAIVSFASLEYDGLARYGDPLAPYGDLQTLVKFACVLKPGGLLYLALEIDSKYEDGDLVLWNAYRRYGRMRMPFVFRYFRPIEAFGWGSDNHFWLVMQNTIGCENAASSAV
eukprot:TRINITY_DN2561_c0_g1_i1.p1 TRINITY_DN2561_c0_g1~~TRINITY_DN2561_c0_g1_i1.p1  ORF type:complete len:382 (-),score=67.58 TRINITY_DN2561_c0_g1_i1:229-1374(-)